MANPVAEVGLPGTADILSPDSHNPRIGDRSGEQD